MGFFAFLLDIFIIESRTGRIPCHPQNLTSHYAVELRQTFFDEVCVGGDYSLLKEKIEQYKYHSHRHISTEFVDILAKCVEVSVNFGETKDWIIIPLPMHWTRYIFRGFHHTSLLAKSLGNTLKIPSLDLLKTKFTKRQAKLSREMRIENKKNSFFIKNGYTVPSHIILIDDVISSGSSLNEAARVLREGGAKKIICFTLASNAQLCQNLSKLSEPKHITSKMLP